MHIFPNLQMNVTYMSLLLCFKEHAMFCFVQTPDGTLLILHSLVQHTVFYVIIYLIYTNTLTVFPVCIALSVKMLFEVQEINANTHTVCCRSVLAAKWLPHMPNDCNLAGLILARDFSSMSYTSAFSSHVSCLLISCQTVQ